MFGSGSVLVQVYFMFGFLVLGKVQVWVGFILGSVGVELKFRLFTTPTVIFHSDSLNLQIHGESFPKVQQWALTCHGFVR
jgi:hypothetical protein